MRTTSTGVSIPLNEGFFTEHRDSPTLTVLLMERIGEPLTWDDYRENKYVVLFIIQERCLIAKREDVDGVLNHIGSRFFLHRDPRRANFLRSAPDGVLVCPEHKPGSSARRRPTRNWFPALIGRST